MLRKETPNADFLKNMKYSQRLKLRQKQVHNKNKQADSFSFCNVH